MKGREEGKNAEKRERDIRYHKRPRMRECSLILFVGILTNIGQESSSSYRQFMAMDSKFESGLTAAGPQLWHIYLICTRRRHTRGILIIWLCSFISTQKNTVLKQILLQNADYLRSPVAYLIRLSSISKRQRHF